MVSALRSNLISGLGILIAIVSKGILVFTKAVPFNSDEAIIALMARHILQGERPIFFYGQAYMGSLDAWLVAGAFRLIGESVFAIRVVQIILYVLFLLTMWSIARLVFKDRLVADISIWVAAIPPILITIYTTATLGGYCETLVLGNLVLLIGYQVTLGRWRSSWWGWLTLGLVSGLAFWTNGLVVVYFVPIAAAGIWTLRKERISYYFVCLIGFFAASSPWWFYNATQGGAALAVFSQGAPTPTNLLSRTIGLITLNVPALFGFRPPWTSQFASIPVQLILIVFQLGTILILIKNRREKIIPMTHGWEALGGIFILTFISIFIGTQFGVDVTGRYLLPLYLSVVLLQALFIGVALKWRKAAGLALLSLVILVNGFETWNAAIAPDKITTQFDPISRFDNQHDDELISFLRDQGEIRGYTNYWVSFRLAFLSGEILIYSAELPYKQDFSYTTMDNRYPAYYTAVAESSKVAYITTLHPELDKRIRVGLIESDVVFQEASIGPYHVFYDLSAVVRPAQFDFVAQDSMP